MPTPILALVLISAVSLASAGTADGGLADPDARQRSTTYDAAIDPSGRIVRVENLDLGPSRDDAPRYHPNRVIILLEDAVDVDHARDARMPVALGDLPGFAAVAEAMQVKRLQPLLRGRDRGPDATAEIVRELARYYLVEFEGPDPLQVVAAYARLPQVKDARPDYRAQQGYVPNDTLFDDARSFFPWDQWHLREAPGIDAVRAWNFCKGDSTVIVSVIDGGVEYDHWDLGGEIDPPSLTDPHTGSSIWVNTAEVPANGIDDDENGFVDDVLGWDFYLETNEIDDYNGHGTQCAGVIAALTGNGFGAAGIAGGNGDGSRIGPRRPGVKIAGVAMAGPYGSAFDSDTAQAFNYVADLKLAGQNIVAISYSFYGPYTQNATNSAINFCASLGILVVGIAGNNDSNQGHWPCYNDNVLCVGAVDTVGVPADFTNYGEWVDVAAPGVDIVTPGVSPDAPEDYWTFVVNGTSFAAPHVAGIAALLKSYDPSLSAQDLRDLIVDNTTPYVPTKDIGSGIANAWLALSQILDEVVITHRGATSVTSPYAAIPVTATIESYGGGTIPEDGAVVHYQVDGGGFLTTPMEPTGNAGEFAASLPAQVLGATVEYYIEATNDEGQVATLPMEAPTELFTAFVHQGIDEDNEEPRGWSIAPLDEETGGSMWKWADPELTVWEGVVIQPDDDHTPTGTHCWVTGPLAGREDTSPDVNNRDYEVDGGRTILYSPRIDLTGATDVSVAYWYYYHETPEPGNVADPGYESWWTVEITNDGGQTWTDIQRTRETTADWQQVTVSLDTMFAEPGIVQLRFAAEDRQSVSLVEAMIDDFHLIGVFGAVGVQDGEFEIAVPATLAQNAPNPFNPMTTIRFELASAGQTSLRIYDVHGRRVRELVSDHLAAGLHTLSWDGRDGGGRPVASGTYVYRLESGNFAANRRMVLVR